MPDPQKLIPTKRLIEIAISSGFDFGKGNPNNRLRYWTKIGLIPHALRKKIGQNEFTEGHYPYYTLNLLRQIQLFKKAGFDNEEIKRRMKKELAKYVVKEAGVEVLKPAKWKIGLGTKTLELPKKLTIATLCFIVIALVSLWVGLTPSGQAKFNQLKADFGKYLVQLIEPYLPHFVSLVPEEEKVAGVKAAPAGGLLSPLASENMISNSSFEAGNLNAEPKGWGFIGQSGSFNTQVSLESIRTGTKGLKINDPACSPPYNQNGCQLGVSQPTTKTINGRDYLFTIYVRSHNLVGSPKLRLMLLGGEGQDRYQDFSLPTQTKPEFSDWQQFKTIFKNAPLNYYPAIEVLDYQGGTVYLDDVGFYETVASQSFIANFNLPSTSEVSESFTSEVSLGGEVTFAPTSYVTEQANTRLGDGSMIANSSGNLYPLGGTLGPGSLGIDSHRFGGLYLTHTSIDGNGNIDSDGKLTVRDKFVADHNLQLGSDANDSLDVRAELISDLIPDADNQYDLGSSSRQWAEAHINALTAGSTTMSGNITMPDDSWIGLGAAKGRIEFDDQGTDEINILSANVGIGTATPGKKLDVVGGDIRSDADLHGGDLYLGYDDGSATLTTTDTNEDLTLDPNGTGDLYFHGSTYQLSDTGDLTLGGRITFENAAYIQNETNGILYFNEPTIQLDASTAIDIDSPTLDLSTQATDIEIKDNQASALTISESTNEYLNISTTDTTTSFSLNLPVTGSTSTTANLFISNLAKTINLGTGTAIDTFNIGTGGTSADDINIGDSLADVDITGASQIVAGTGDSLTITANAASTWSVTSGDLALDAVANSLNLYAGEDAADSIVISSDQGGIDITTASTEDIDITATGGVNISSSETAAGALSLQATGSNAATTLVLSSAGTGATALDIDSSGGIEIDAAASATIALEVGAAGTLNFGADNVAKTINLGIGTAADTINIGTGGTAADDINLGGLATSTIDLLGVTKLGDGGSTNYAQFSATGDLTLVGSADTITGPGSTLTITNPGANIALQTTTSGDITATTGASTGLFNVLTGNLKVGNATPTYTLDGEDAYIEGNLEVDGNVYLGDSTADSLTVSGYVTSNLIPDPGSQYDLGSNTRKWLNVWADTVTASNLSGTVVTGSTSSYDWAIGVGYTGPDAQDMTLTFERGGPATNAEIRWDSTNKYISTNAPGFVIAPDSGITASGKAALIVNQIQNQDILTASASGTPKFVIKNSGNVGIGMTGPTGKLSVAGGVGIGTTAASSDYHSVATPPDGGMIIEGNVGIGTTAPGSYKLNVQGNIYGLGTLTIAGTSILGDSATTVSFDAVTDFDVATSNASAADIDIGTSSQANTISIGTSTASSTLELDSADWGITTTGVIDGISGYTQADGSFSHTGSTSTLDLTGAVSWDTDSSMTLGAQSYALTVDGGTITITGDGTNDINLVNTGANLDIDVSTIDLSTQATTINLADSQVRALNIESGLLNLDTFNTRVGIGTTAPDYTLEVIGNGRFSTDLTLTGGDILGPSGENIDLGEAAADTITFYLASAGELTLGANALAPATTNDLDLGTSSLMFRDLYLDGGNINFGASTTIGDNGDAITLDSSGTLTIADTTLDINAASSIFTFSSATGVKQIQTGGTTDLALMPGGNVGIGMTAPGAYKLNVNGNTYINGTLAVVGNTTITGNLLPAADDQYDIGENTTPLRWRDLYLGPGSIHIGGSGDEYAITYDTTNNRLGFNVNNSGDAEIVFDSSGNVGIGTTGPGRVLEVSGTSNPYIKVSGGASTDSGFELYRGSTLIWSLGREYSADNSDSFYLYTGQSATPGTHLAVTTSGNVGLGGVITNNATLAGASMVVQQDGNVGIGTTGPSEKLDVVGDIEVSGVGQFGGITGTAYSAISDSGTATYAASDDDLYIEDILEVGGASYFAGTLTANGTLDTNGLFTLGDGGDTGAISTSDWAISTTGVMTGITGITTDDVILLPDGSAAAPALSFSGDTDTGLYRIASDKISLITGGTVGRGITIDSGGNVGIGITSPTVALDVVGAGKFSTNLAASTGNINLADTSGNVTIGNASGTLALASNAFNLTTAGAVSGITTLSMSNQLTNSYANTAALNLTGDASGITFGGTGVNQIITGGTNNLALMPGGNVGIGTTGPSEALDVVGDLEVSGVGQFGGITGTAYSAISDSGTATYAASDDDLYIEDILEVGGASYFAGTLTANGQFTLGDGGDTGAINTSDWDISTTGVMTGITGITTDDVILLPDGSAAAPALSFSSDTDSGLYRIGADKISLITGGTVGRGITIDSSGNVGIGTTGPSEALDVVGDLEVSGVGQFGGITGTAYSAISDSGTANIAASDDDLYIEDVLEVDGEIEVDGALDADGEVTIADTDISFDGASTTFTTTGTFTLTPGGAVTLGDGGDTMYINSSDWDISTTGDMTGIGAITVDGDFTLSKADPSVIFNVTAAGSTDFWLGVQDDADAVDDDLFMIGDGTTPGTNPFLTIDTAGNVGIGTTGPGNLLTVSKSDLNHITPIFYLENTGSTVGGIKMKPIADAAGGWLSFAGDPTTSVEVPAVITSQHGSRYPGIFGYTAGVSNTTSRFYFLTSPPGTSQSATEVMSITNAGNVGIGTTGPSQKLHVAGNCVTGDSQLIREDGQLLRVDEVKGGEKVYSLDQETGKIVPARVLALLDMGFKPTFELTTEDGRSIITTGNHPYLTQDGWKKVIYLEKGQKIAVPKEERLASFGGRFLTSPNRKNSNCQSKDCHRQTTNHISKLEGNHRLVNSLVNLQLITQQVKVNTKPNNITATLPLSSGEISGETTIIPKKTWPALSNILAKRNNSSETNLINQKVAQGTSDVKWVKIVSIKPAGIRQVWDLSIENTHNFVANGIIAHNTYISSNLEVDGTTQLDGAFTLGDGGDTGAINTSDWDISTTGVMTGITGITTDDVILLPDGSAAAPALAFSADTDSGLYRIASDKISLITGGTVGRGITIDSSGNVGIGTTGPSNPLHIRTTSGNAYVRAETTANNAAAGVVLYRNDGTYTDEWYIYNPANSRRLSLGLAAAETLVLDSGGNVGIGTTGPNAKLEISDGTDSLQIAAAGDLTFVDANGGASITGPAGGALTVQAGASQALTLTGNAASTWSVSSGNLTLDVNGDIVLDADGADIDFQDAGTSILKITNSSSDAVLQPQQTNKDIIFKEDGGTEIARFDSSGESLLINSSKKIEFADTGEYITSDGTDLTIASGDDIILSPTGNVGIGTTGPGYKLEVAGTGRFSNVLTLNGGVTGANPTPQLNFGGYYANAGTPTGGPSHIVLYDTTDKYGFGVSAAPGTLDVWTAGAVKFNKYTGGVASSLNVIIDSSGNVGIGTTGPGAPLEIKGALNQSHLILRSSSGYTTGSYQDISFYDGTTPEAAKIRSLTHAAGDEALSFWTYSTGTGTSEKVRITGAGNVGIGTTGPNEKLEIVGGRLRLPQTNEQATPTLNFGDGDTGFYESSDDLFHLVLGATARWTFSSDSLQGAVGSGPSMLNEAVSATNPVFALTQDSDTGLGSAGADILSLIAGGTNVMNITAGNVGIGTTGPGARLDILADGSQELNFSGADAASIYHSSSGESLYINTNAGNLYLGDSLGDDDLSIVSSKVGIGGNPGSAKLYINGNVGIGTTNPLSKLEVNGVGSFSLGTLSAPGISFNGDLDTGIWSSGANAVNVSTGGSERVRIDSSGNVGIGTTGPGSKLEVNGDITLGDDDWIGIGSAAERIIFDSDGGDIELMGADVGIGAQTPAGSLEIYDDASDADLIITPGGGYNPIIQFRAFAVPNPLTKFTMGVDTSDSDKFKIGTTGLTTNTRLTIDSSGNVGIGTTAPSSLLELSSTAPTFRMTDTTASAKSLVITTDGNLAQFEEAGGSANDLFVLDLANARVGIGTTAPGDGLTLGGSARHSRRIDLHAEYPGAVLTTFYGAGTDTSITGSMTADIEANATDVQRTYYEWTSTEAGLNYYTVAVRVTLPQDFSAWATSNALQVDFVTETTNAAQNVLDVYVYLDSNTTTAVASDTANASAVADTWETVTIDDSVLDDGGAPEWDAAGETAVIYLRMGSLTATDAKHARVGDIKLNYLSKW